MYTDIKKVRCVLELGRSDADEVGMDVVRVLQIQRDGYDGSSTCRMNAAAITMWRQRGECSCYNVAVVSSKPA